MCPSLFRVLNFNRDAGVHAALRVALYRLVELNWATLRSGPSLAGVEECRPSVCGGVGCPGLVVDVADAEGVAALVFGHDLCIPLSPCGDDAVRQVSHENPG